MGPGSGSITANFVATTQVLGGFNYTSNPALGGQSNYYNITTPGSYTNSPLSALNTTLYPTTGTYAGYPFEVITATTSTNNTKYVFLYWTVNMTSNNPSYPGNVSVDLTMEPDPSNSADAIVVSSTVYFVPANGQPVLSPQAETYETSFGDLLYSSLSALASEISQQAQYLIGTSQNTFGEELSQMSTGLNVFGGYLGNSQSPPQYTALGNIWVINMATFTTNADVANCQTAIKNAYGQGAGVVIFFFPYGPELVEAMHDVNSVAGFYDVWNACQGP